MEAFRAAELTYGAACLAVSAARNVRPGEVPALRLAVAAREHEVLVALDYALGVHRACLRVRCSGVPPRPPRTDIVRAMNSFWQ